MNYNNIEFWEQVKKEYQVNICWIYLCVASVTFENEFRNNNESIVKLSNEFTSKSENYKNVFSDNKTLFKGLNCPEGTKKQKIRIEFINYMIEKLSK